MDYLTRFFSLRAFAFSLSYAFRNLSISFCCEQHTPNNEIAMFRQIPCVSSIVIYVSRFDRTEFLCNTLIPQNSYLSTVNRGLNLKIS